MTMPGTGKSFGFYHLEVPLSKSLSSVLGQELYYRRAERMSVKHDPKKLCCKEEFAVGRFDFVLFFNM